MIRRTYQHVIARASLYCVEPLVRRGFLQHLPSKYRCEDQINVLPSDRWATGTVLYGKSCSKKSGLGYCIMFKKKVR